MPIVGVKDTRKQQLIEATMASIAELGMQNTTIVSISKRAGMSSGIISHYTEAARQTAAMIDGFWLRSALSLDPMESFEAGERLTKQFIEQTLASAGAANSSN